MVRSWIIPVALIAALGRFTLSGAEPAVLPPESLDRLVQRDQLKEESQRLAGEGKFSEAIVHTEKLREIEREVLGETHADLLNSLASLIRWNAVQGNLAAAKKLAADNLERERQPHPDTHWRVTTSRKLVALVERCQGLDQAQQDQLKEGEQLHAQGFRLADDDKYADAAPILAKASELLKQVLGEENPEYLTSLSNLGWCYRELDDFERAEPLLKDVIQRRKKALGEDHPDYALSHNVLGWLYVSRKQFSEAEPLFRRAAEIHQRGEGETSDGYIQSLDNLAELYVRSRNFRRAEALRQQALELRKASHGEKHPLYAEQLKALAIVYEYLEQYDKAEPLLLQALEIFRVTKGEESSESIDVLVNLTYVYENLGKPAEALPLEKRLLEIKRKTLGDTDVKTGVQWHRLASIQIALNDFREALACERQAAEIFQKSLGEKGENTLTARGRIAWLLDSIAHQAKERGDYPAAKKAAAEAIEVLAARFGSAHWRTAQGRQQLEYIVFWEKCSPAERAELRAANEAEMKSQSLRETNPVAALHETEKYLAIRQRILTEEHWLTVRSLMDVGLLHKEIGNYDKCRPIYLRLPELTRKLLGERSPNYWTSLHNLGALHLDLGENLEAKAVLERALAIGRQVFPDDPESYVEIINSLAHAEDALGETAAAESLYLQSLQIRHQGYGENSVEYAEGHLHLGFFYMSSQADYAKAEIHLKEAVSIFRGTVGEKHPRYAYGIDFLAAFYTITSRFDLAEPLYREAIAVREATLGPEHVNFATSLKNLGFMYVAQAKYKEAEELLLRALEIERKIAGNNHPRTAKTLNGLAQTAAGRGDPAKAHQWHQQCLEVCQQVYDSANPEYNESQSRLAASYARIGQAAKGLPLALSSLRTARTVLERQALFQSERQQLGMRLALWGYVDRYLEVAALARTPAEEVYAEVLNWKGLVGARQQALRKIHHQLRASGNPQVVKLENELDDSVKKLAALSHVSKPGDLEHRFRVAEVSDRIETLQQDLTKFSAELRRQSEQAQTAPADIRQALPGDVALVDFLCHQRYRAPRQGQEQGAWESILIAFVVRAEQPIERVELGPAGTIEKAIEAWRSKFGRPTATTNPGAELRRLVWEPLQAHLAGAKTVLISPNGTTAPMPWAALPGAKPGTYLLEETAFAVVPIPRCLPDLLAATGAAPRRLSGSLLLVGDVDFSAGLASRDSAVPEQVAVRGEQFYNWSPLPGTREEVQAIKGAFLKLAPAAAAVELAQDRATKSAVLAQAGSHEYLHLATHGFFAPANSNQDVQPSESPSAVQAGVLHPGLLSGLVLSGANHRPELGQADGILTALEVEQLDLSKVRLVTLSACETGLGKTAGGEGLLGLQRSIQLAGARTLVSSVWSVDDAATQALMAEFYRNLWEKKLGKLESLRQAQITMLDQYDPALRKLQPRGISRVATGSPDLVEKRLTPYFWAAFVLSGDWR